MGWDYGAAPESSAVARVKPSYGPFIDGSVGAGSGTQVTCNPATGGPLADVGTAGPAEVDRAVAAARRARDGAWGAMAGPERARLLFRVAGAVAGRARELAVLETLDTGRPVRVTGDVDLPLAVAHLQACAGWADKLGYAGHGPDPRPVGVIGVLVESRTPVLAAVRRIAPALACGNAVVLVPDPDAPLSALVLAETAAEAGLPAGVLNVLPVADAVAGHADLDAVAVTGSAGTCRNVARSVAGTGRRLAVEPDGRTVHVVHDDAPLDQAVDGVADGLGTDQQVLVAEAVAEEFGELLRERLSRLQVGDPLDRNTDVGPVGTAARRERAEALAAADEEGAHRVTSPAALPDQGLFVAPTLFTDVAPTMGLAREEVTGPLVPVLTFRTPAEAVAVARAGRPVRAAAVWTDKGSRALWTARNLRAGVVWVNAVDRSDPAAPFGGAVLADYLEAGPRSPVS
jgi:aldehyde dehydrogenase (NAD+)